MTVKGRAKNSPAAIDGQWPAAEMVYGFSLVT